MIVLYYYVVWETRNSGIRHGVPWCLIVYVEAVVHGGFLWMSHGISLSIVRRSYMGFPPDVNTQPNGLGQQAMTVARSTCLPFHRFFVCLKLTPRCSPCTLHCRTSEARWVTSLEMMKIGGRQWPRAGTTARRCFYRSPLRQGKRLSHCSSCPTPAQRCCGRGGIAWQLPCLYGFVVARSQCGSLSQGVVLQNVKQIFGASNRRSPQTYVMCPFHSGVLYVLEYRLSCDHHT